LLLKYIRSDHSRQADRKKTLLRSFRLHYLFKRYFYIRFYRASGQSPILISLLACYMIKALVAFWRAGFFPANQGFLKTSDCFDWLDKSRPSKKVTFVLIM